VWRLGWGPSSPSAKLALGQLGYLGHQIEFARGYFLSAPDAKETEWYDSQGNLLFEEDVWMAIFELWSLNWCKRLWELQEIHLGTIEAVPMCGKGQILWTVFSQASGRIYYRPGGILKKKRLETVDVARCVTTSQSCTSNACCGCSL